jgi:hypothetical protein
VQAVAITANYDYNYYYYYNTTADNTATNHTFDWHSIATNRI